MSDTQTKTTTTTQSKSTFDAVIVGAGFAGMYMLHKLRELGFSARVFEAGQSVGGTWYWNRYPGARCDVESLEYQYSVSDALQREWDWTERYATQPEVLDYCNHVADRFELWPDMQLETRVTSAVYDESNDRWTVETDRGDHVSAQHLVMATGCLSASRLPDYPGIESFQGATYHTGRWPHEGVDFTGQRVAVIGTGSSAIQSFPESPSRPHNLRSSSARLTSASPPRITNLTLPTSPASKTSSRTSGERSRPPDLALPLRRRGTRPRLSNSQRRSVSGSTNGAGRSAASAFLWPTQTSSSARKRTTPPLSLSAPSSVRP